MTIRYYDWRNTIMESALGVIPMATLLWISNDPSDFLQKAKSYILSYEIQLLFVCYLGFGLAVATLNLRLWFSRTLLLLSFEFISAFISIGQAFAGFSIFLCGIGFMENAYSLIMQSAGMYCVFHFSTINLAAYLAFLKQKSR